MGEFFGEKKFKKTFETDRSLLIEICEIPVKKAKNDDPRKMCWDISQVANVF
jgi:hypothetical protein